MASRTVKRPKYVKRVDGIIEIDLFNIVHTLHFVPGKSLPKNQVANCDGPHIKNPKLRISRRLHSKNKLEKIIHEFLHKADWHKDEEWVVHVAACLADLLWEVYHGVGYSAKKGARGHHTRKNY